MPDENCPSCGTPYEAEATFCINCGAKRAPAAPTPVPEAAAPPPPVEPAPTPAPAPTASPAAPAAPVPDEQVLTRLDEKLGETPPPPTEPKKKSKKGCCIALVIVGVLFILAGLCILGVYGYNQGWFSGFAGGGKGYTNDFATVSEDAFTVWQKGPGSVVAGENGMLKVKDALVGVNYDAGADYTVSCRVIVAGVDAKRGGWAGVVARVNPGGGDRYAFELLPQEKVARIVKINAQGKPETLAAQKIAELAVGQPFTVEAVVSGQDLTMKVEGTPVAQTTYIGLAEGPAGMEARGATAYFDDLNITPH